MANHCHGLSRCKKLLEEMHRRTIQPELIGIRNAARQNGAIEVLGLEVTGDGIHVKRISLFEMVERLHVITLRSRENRSASSLLHCLPGSGQLDLFHTFISHQKDDGLSGELIGHGSLLVWHHRYWFLIAHLPLPDGVQS